MAGGIDINGGGIDMYPEPTRAAITEFGAATAAIHANFDRRIGEIAALDGQLGKGRLGEQAARQYNPFMDQVRGEMDRLRPIAEQRTRDGLEVVDQYVRQDLENRELIRRTQAAPGGG